MSLRDALQAIYDEYGELTAERLVEVAKPKSHPLHGRIYDRTPKEAAEAWWLHRAEELIRSVRVTYTKTDGTRERVRWYHPVRSDAGVYDPLDVIADDPIATEVLLRAAERQWQEMFTRYGHLQAFIELVQKDVAA